MIHPCRLCGREISLRNGVASFRGAMAHIECWLDWHAGRAASPRPVVLMVEDDETTRYTNRRALDPAFDVIEAPTAQAALAAIDREPDVVLLDLQLPDLDGFEVCRRIKSDPARSWMRVLVVTAVFTNEAYRRQAIQAGADGFLIKPVEANALVTAIKRLIGMG
jgi:DNA-binding response OmpR family regulator